MASKGKSSKSPNKVKTGTKLRKRDGRGRFA